MIPAHQLCTDCKEAPRALAAGIQGYGCLCQKCFEKRIEDAKRKKKPKRLTAKEQREAWLHEVMSEDETQHFQEATGISQLDDPNQL